MVIVAVGENDGVYLGKVDAHGLAVAQAHIGVASVQQKFAPVRLYEETEGGFAQVVLVDKSMVVRQHSQLHDVAFLPSGLLFFA